MKAYGIRCIEPLSNYLEVSGELHAWATLLLSGGCWMEARTGLDDVNKEKITPLPGPEFRPLGRPTRSQSLYPLRYPSSVEQYMNYNLQYSAIFSYWQVCLL
jgi:hypothetical protein